MEKHEKSHEKNTQTDKKRDHERRRREAQFAAEKKPRPCEMGTAFHTVEAKNIQAQETGSKKQEGKDFDVEKRLKHPDGKDVRLDQVDYQQGIITDHKQIAQNENLETFLAKNEPQRTKHSEAYEYNRKKKELPEGAKKLREYRYDNLGGSSKDHVGDFPNVKEVSVTIDQKGKETAEVELLTDGPLMTDIKNIEKRKREAYFQSGLYDDKRKKQQFESRQAEEE